MERVTRFAPMPHFGEIGVTVTPQGLIQVLWARPDPLGSRLAGPTGDGAAPLEEMAAQWLAHIREYLEGQRRAFPLPIAWETLPPFQRAVLRATFAIPYGQVRTYGEVAAAIGRPRAARAVGRALGTNPMPIVIPCHRVVGHGGRLHGYSAPGGLEVKAWLLRLEGVTLPEGGEP